MSRRTRQSLLSQQGEDVIDAVPYSSSSSSSSSPSTSPSLSPATMENPNPDGDETIAITQEEPTNTGTEEDLEQAKGQFLAALDKSRDEIHTGLEHLRNTWSRRCSRRGDLRRHEPPMSMLSERVFPLYFFETCTGDQFKTTMSCLPFENPSINSKLAKNITVCGSRYDLDPPKGSLLFFLGINICVSTYALRQLITLKKKHPDVDWKTVYSHIAQASSERRKLSYKKIIVTTAGPRNLQVADVGSGIKRRKFFTSIKIFTKVN